MVDAKLWIVGDPMVDVYHIGAWNKSRFIPETTIRRPGGAANVYANAAAIVSELKDEQSIGIYTGWIPGKFRMLELLRLVQPDGQVLEVYGDACPVRETYYSKVEGLYIMDQAIWARAREFYGPEALIISDYNRGFVNEQRINAGKPLTFKRKPKFAIVDSRFRSTDLSLIKDIPVKIWRCSGEECNEEWAKNFHWIVRTSHGGPIAIEHRKSGVTHWLTPPQPERVVDDCGAGDTFTAALGAHLLKHLQDEDEAIVDMTSMIRAAEFASLAASDVVQKRYTAVTDIRL
jgi:bifunctional ADP-heptose synthase (sugar kinase/adenylyltransferase)